MSTTLWNKHEYAKCWGKWLVSDPECVRCASSDACEKRTKARAEERYNNNEPEGKGNGEDEENPVLTPVEYLLQRLSGKFEYSKDERDRAVIHNFLDNGHLVIVVVIGVYGKIKIVSVVKNLKKVYGSLSSVEEVEEVLAEML